MIVIQSSVILNSVRLIVANVQHFLEPVQEDCQ